MQENFQFDREKFKDVVHYIVEYANCNYDPDSLGNTKLHKILYFTDMLRYLTAGRPMTGAEYQRQRFGPTARYLSWALKELEAEARVSVSRRDYYGYSKSDYTALASPAPDRLSGEDVDLIKHVAAFVCLRSAAEISDFSHDDVWSSAPMGQRIPYYAAFAMFPPEVTDEDIERCHTRGHPHRPSDG